VYDVNAEWRVIELLGLLEVAKLAGLAVKPSATGNAASHNMPKPLAVLASGPVWDGAEIRKWLKETGFTPPETRSRSLLCTACS